LPQELLFIIPNFDVRLQIVIPTCVNRPSRFPAPCSRRTSRKNSEHKIAAIDQLTQVYSRMLGEIGTIGECFGALGTFIRFCLPHVYLGVKLQIRFGSEDL